MFNIGGTAMAPSGHLARQLARIQRVCCLGLGGELVLPELMSELGKLIPSESQTFFWADSQLRLANMFSDSLLVAELAPLYLTEYHNNREREVVKTFTEYMQATYACPVALFHERAVKVGPRTLQRSAFYNEIMRPLGYDQLLQAQVAANGRKLGAWQIGRPLKAAPFTKREVRILQAIVPFIAHALTDSRLEDRFVETEDRGLVIADAQGSVQHCSRRGRALLLLATQSMLSSATANFLRLDRLPDAVLQLCKQMAIYKEETVLHFAPVVSTRNNWGEFLFRVYTLEQSVTASIPLVGITIERREPLRLKLARQVGMLPLSAREAQLCLALVRGRRRKDIAADMGISDQTLITHVRHLYAKLDVRTQAELISKIYQQG